MELKVCDQIGMADNLYLAKLGELMTIKPTLNIVVVGANDGKVNDPIYAFVMGLANRTRILLIEPNQALLPHLQHSYALHPCHQIANCAIGPEGTLVLHAIKQQWFDRFQPAYAEGWPPYRAATGLTSANRDHLERALLREGLPADEAIETLNVPTKALTTVLTELDWPVPIDVLQIDAEGCDDSVIYASNLEQTRPTLIHFENRHIPQSRMEPLLSHLSSHHYQIHTIEGDTLAIRR
jgi:FkbM family methyltransferase